MLTTNILHNHVDCLPMTLIFELCKMSKLPKGAFNNYVDRFCHFLPPPPLRGQFLYPERGQK